MPQELKPCPICKSGLLTYIIANHSARIQVMCICGCSGGYKETKAEAVAAWNALPRTPDPLTKPNMITLEDWLTAVETAARGDIAGDPEATKRLDELGPAAVILRLVGMVRRNA